MRYDAAMRCVVYYPYHTINCTYRTVSFTHDARHVSDACLGTRQVKGVDFDRAPREEGGGWLRRRDAGVRACRSVSASCEHGPYKTVKARYKTVKARASKAVNAGIWL